MTTTKTIAPRWWGWALGAIMFVALLLRVLAALTVPEIIGPDAERYNRAAVELLETKTFSTTDAGPLYPAFVAVIYRLFGIHDGRSVQLVQAVCWACAVGLMGLIGRRLFGATAGILAAAFAAVYPPFIKYQAYAGSVYYATESLFIWLLLLMIWWLVSEDPPPMRRVVGAGVWLGLATLTRPITLLFPLFLGMTWLCRRPRAARELARWIVGLCLGATVVLIPWTVRNYRVYHALVPVTASGGGLVLLGGNNPSSSGEPVDVSRNPEYRQAFTIEDPIERDRAYAKLAVEFWRTLTPAQWVRLLANKSFLFWTDFGPAYNVAYGMMVPLSWLGMWISRRRPNALVLHALILYTFCFSLVFTAYARMRLPIEPCLILLAAAGAVWVVRRLRHRLVAVLLLTGWVGLHLALAKWWGLLSRLINVV